MAIEFRCPECSALVRVPDSAAGKKGRCPTCSAVVPIPATSQPTATPAPAAPTSASGGAKLTPDGKLEFACTSCSKPVRVPGSSAGKKGRCPHCQTIVDIPHPAATQPSGAASSTTSSPAASSAGGPIEFNCPLCAKLVKTPAAAAGKKGKCPHCQGVVDIPLKSTAVAKPTPAPAATGPIEFACPRCGNSVKTPASAAGKKGKCPKCQTVVDIPLTSQRPAAPASSGLTFLPETPANDPFGGLTPIGGADPLADFGGGGLTPIDGGLTPMGNDPFGGDPLGGFGGGGDPLGDLNQFGDLGSGAAMPAFNAPASFNPYAAPPAPVKQAKGGKSAYRGGGARRGLPWENRKSGQVDSPFLGTVKMVLFDSSNAFKAMKTEGGLGDPIGFAFMGNVIGNLATAGYAAVFLLIGFFLGGDADGGSVAALGIGIGQQFFMALVQAGTRATIGMFVFAGITHLLLMMVKGANRSYETTFRALAYSDGALAFCGVIPCLGALVQLIGMLIISIIAVMNAHETSGGKAAFAILMPILLCCVSVGVLVFLFIGVIGAIVSGAGQ